MDSYWFYGKSNTEVSKNDSHVDRNSQVKRNIQENLWQRDKTDRRKKKYKR